MSPPGQSTCQTGSSGCASMPLLATSDCDHITIPWHGQCHGRYIPAQAVMLCVWLCEFCGIVLLVVTASLKVSYRDNKQKYFRQPIIQVNLFTHHAVSMHLSVEVICAAIQLRHCSCVRTERQSCHRFNLLCRPSGVLFDILPSAVHCETVGKAVVRPCLLTMSASSLVAGLMPQPAGVDRDHNRGRSRCSCV